MKNPKLCRKLDGQRKGGVHCRVVWLSLLYLFLAGQDFWLLAPGLTSQSSGQVQQVKLSRATKTTRKTIHKNSDQIKENKIAKTNNKQAQKGESQIPEQLMLKRISITGTRMLLTWLWLCLTSPKEYSYKHTHTHTVAHTHTHTHSHVWVHTACQSWALSEWSVECLFTFDAMQLFWTSEYEWV